MASIWEGDAARSANSIDAPNRESTLQGKFHLEVTQKIDLVYFEAAIGAIWQDIYGARPKPTIYGTAHLNPGQNHSFTVIYALGTAMERLWYVSVLAHLAD